VILLAVVCLSPALASANPRALPFTYTTDTLVDGQVEIEQYVDLAPRKAAAADSQNAWFLPSAFLTEIEVGLAERLELGLYLTFVPTPSAEQFQNVGQFPGMGNGLKQRLRYVFADLGEWPIDVGVYGELTENEREVEFEGKLLLQRRFGDLRIAANLSSEYEYYFASHQREVVLDPSAGITYEASAKLHLGIDSWLRSEYPMHPKPMMRTFGLGPAAYVGPAVMYNFGKLWWAVGAYVRVTDFDHTLVAGEPYGPLYVRSMVGYNL
jgi:hypothetical protein